MSTLEEIVQFLNYSEDIHGSYIYDPIMTEEELMNTLEIAEQNTNVKSLIGYIPYKYVLICKYDHRTRTHINESSSLFILYWMRYQLNGAKRTCKLDCIEFDMSKIECDTIKMNAMISDIPKAEDLLPIEVETNQYFKTMSEINDYRLKNMKFK